MSHNMRKKKRNTGPSSLNPHFWLTSIIWVVLVLALFLVPLFFGDFSKVIRTSWFQIIALTLFVSLSISICNKMTDVFCLRREESGITSCQITILISMILWIIGFLLIFNIQKDSRYFIVFGIIGTMLGWVFQDTLKGVMAFLHVRLNHLLSIDDWIQVPKYNVDGEVKRITLTTLTVYNWDTTTSSIPTSALHSDHFINLQKMALGKTYGRLMKKDFLLDTSLFHPLSREEVERLKHMDELRHLLPEEEIYEGAINAHLYRRYIYHWLMNDPIVSQQPRLMVSWQEQKEVGMTLQVYVHIMRGGYSAFEWQQSRITEHIVESLDWFGLRLYQSPSSHDINSCMNSLTNPKATNRKETTA